MSDYKVRSTEELALSLSTLDKPKASTVAIQSAKKSLEELELEAKLARQLYLSKKYEDMLPHILEYVDSLSKNPQGMVIISSVGGILGLDFASFLHSVESGELYKSIHENIYYRVGVDNGQKC